MTYSFAVECRPGLSHVHGILSVRPPEYDGREKDSMGIYPRRAGAGARPGLTTREVDVLKLLSRGYTYTEIGVKLGISVHTVTSHIKKSYRKLGVHSAAAAVTRAAELGLLGRVRDG
jgi:DNA-binding CsgD family transcriptional regulator